MNSLINARSRICFVFRYHLSPFVQGDTKDFIQNLINIVQITISSKLLTHEMNHRSVLINL